MPEVLDPGEARFAALRALQGEREDAQNIAATLRAFVAFVRWWNREIEVIPIQPAEIGKVLPLLAYLRRVRGVAPGDTVSYLLQIENLCLALEHGNFLEGFNLILLTQLAEELQSVSTLPVGCY